VDDTGVHCPAALTALDHQRVEGHVRVRRSIERPGAEVLDDLVEALRQPGDLALAHPLDAELLHQLLHPTGGDAGEVSVGYHRHERLLRPPPRLEQPVRKVAALPQLRHRELN